MITRKQLSLRLAALVAVGTLAAIGATAASAQSGSDCPTYTSKQVFLPWVDPGYYFLGPGGSFENTLTGWTAKNGAKIVSGNESYNVNSASDSKSLSLPSGSSAATPSICVTADTPDVRLFVRNTGSVTSTLNVNMTYTNKKGKPTTLTVASLLGGSSWSLSLPVLILANIQPLLDGTGSTYVTFTFAPVGSSGKWQIDDFYVDPIKHH